MMYPIFFKENKWFFVVGAAAILAAALALYFLFIQTPSNFQPETVITVSPGESVSAIAKDLSALHIVSHLDLFMDLVIAQGGERKVLSGDYIFHSRESVFSVSRRFVTANFEITPVKITIPEGSTSFDIAEILSKKFSNFNPVLFLSKTKGEEGYLFPDTYFIFANTDPGDIAKNMENNFNTRITPLQSEISTSGHSLSQIITVASIVEVEAATTTDRKIVAGIIWKRLSDGIPLQLDSTLKYVTGKTSDELTAQDLKSDSSYNTYVHIGLPPTPISNPGLDSIGAALNPTETPYYFFLADKNGKMHYATTLKQHDANIATYLR